MNTGHSCLSTIKFVINENVAASQGDRTGHRYYRDRNTGNDQESK